MTVGPLASRLFAKLAKGAVTNNGFQTVTTKTTPTYTCCISFRYVVA